MLTLTQKDRESAIASLTQLQMAQYWIGVVAVKEDGPAVANLIRPYGLDSLYLDLGSHIRQIESALQQGITTTKGE